MLFDTHSHIFLGTKNEKDIMSELKENNIGYITHIGVDIESSKKCIDLAKKYKNNSIATVGIHPCYVEEQNGNISEIINILEKLIVENREFIKAIGECGLDYHYTDNYNKKEKQEIYFKEQIKLAQKYDLPIVIHTRDAKDDTLRIIKETGLKKFVLHCFSEDLDFALKAIYESNKCKISFSGIVTYKSAKNVALTAANIPLDRILIETDCPYLAPQDVRGQENFPKYVKYNLEKIIELRQKNGKNETSEQIETQIYDNSIKFFNI